MSGDIAIMNDNAKNLIFKKCDALIKICNENKNDLIDILTDIETYKTAVDEIDRSIFCLQNVEKQIDYLCSKKVDICTAYLPQNQPFYSMILFAVIPSLMCNSIYVRPPVLLNNIYKKISMFLDIDNIFVINCSRSSFYKNYVINSEVIIFTGKLENAKSIVSKLPKNVLFIFNGSGCNPVIVKSSAAINDDLISKVVSTQTYNSGQDCMAPSAIFIDSQISDIFVAKLVNSVNNLAVGKNSNHDTDIGPIIDKSALVNVNRYISRSKVLFGGDICLSKKTICPTVLLFSSIDDLPQTELFAPIFCLYIFKKIDEIEKYFTFDWVRENCAYVSVFGHGPINIKLGKEILLCNNVLDSIDNGFSEFGGFGEGSSFIYINGMQESKPVLISREISIYAEKV
jgi:acyl-CoA reductase-like NAD-dependent aldehyde dehydrogenase